MSKLQRVIEGFRHQVGTVIPVEGAPVPDTDEAGSIPQPVISGTALGLEAMAARDRAVLDLMVLAMFADGVSEHGERQLIVEFATSRHWPPATNGVVEVDEAIARVRTALDSSETRTELISGIFERLTELSDQLLALDHLEEISKSDGVIDESEQALISLLRDRLG